MSPAPRAVLRARLAPVLAWAARAYVAGPHLEDALRVARRVAPRGFRTTVGFWNDRESPREVADTYVAALAALAGERFDGYVSVKAPALDFAVPLVSEVLAASRQTGVAVHFDALGPRTVEPTFTAIEAAGVPPGLGLTLPGRWRRSVADAERAAALAARIRVVKGQEPADEGGEVDPACGFLEVIERLAGRARRVAVATHDAGLARAALERLRAARTACELELLFGLPLARPVRVARRAEVVTRLYVPYGHAWLPYLLSHARRRPAVVWWMARDVLRGGSPLRAKE